MGKKCDWKCWEIMNCDESRKCPAKTSPETPCWEIAREKSDYRYILQICVDCVVHILKGENTTLSKNEIQSIMANKERCALSRDGCLPVPKYMNSSAGTGLNLPRYNSLAKV